MKNNFFRNMIIAVFTVLAVIGMTSCDEVMNAFRESDSYTVTFDFNYEGSPNAIEVSVDNGETIFAPQEIPIRTGYVISGWYHEAEGITEWNFSRDVVEEDITLYAKWIKAETGTFKIRITGIPSDVIVAIRNGAVTIGMGPVNSTLYEDGSNAVAGRATSGHGEDEVIGSNYYEFYMYHPFNGTRYIGVSGNYDIGFANFEEKRVARNFPLVANVAYNIIPYALFLPI